MKKPLILIVGVLVLFGLAFTLPVTEWIAAGLSWIEANRTISWLVFIGVYAIATVLLLPGSLLTLGGGFVFGLGYGYVIVAIASVSGASLAFLVGRFLARDWVAAKLKDYPSFAALDRAVGEKGALIVFLTRLSPVFPFNLLNYALGLTSVPFVTYVAVSWVGMIPGTLLYVYLGSVASDLTALFSGELADTDLAGTLFYVGLAATLVLTIVITRIATQALGKQLKDTA